jgi:hypothetical protein
MSFFDLGEQYQMAGLKKMAEVAMIANLTTENMLKYFSAGDMFTGKELKGSSQSIHQKEQEEFSEARGLEGCSQGQRVAAGSNRVSFF